MNPGVLFTFDVECSMGGSWNDPSLKPVPPRLGMMGDYGNRRMGLPLICDILDRHSLKATFFLEPFNEALGWPGETEPVVQYLVGRGQDVQLHIHPNHVHYGQHKAGKSFLMTDQMADLPVEEQEALLRSGAELLEKWSGVRPIAFRAGNMGASEETLHAMRKSGLWIDSSYTFPYVGKQCCFRETERYNGAKWYGDILEVALSAFQQTKLPGMPATMPVDLMGASFEECRDAVKMICDSGADAVAILHSFSLFKVRDRQYHGGRPNRIVIRRFERFCLWLNENRRKYPPRTFAEFGRLVRDGYQPKAVPPCLINKPLRALTRKAVQGLNSFYWF